MAEAADQIDELEARIRELELGVAATSKILNGDRKDDNTNELAKHDSLYTFDHIFPPS